MLKRLHLLRHGRSAHAHPTEWLDAAGYQAWRDGYDSAGIDLRHQAPAEVQRIIAEADCVISSDLRRAIESAEHLSSGGTILQSALLREAPLPIPPWRSLRLPLAGWEALTHAHWSYHALRRNDPTHQHLDRARNAISWLEALDRDAGTVAVVTHGVFRRLLRSQLEQRGWRAIAPNRSYRCWSAWSFARVSS